MLRKTLRKARGELYEARAAGVWESPGCRPSLAELGLELAMCVTDELKEGVKSSSNRSFALIGDFMLAFREWTEDMGGRGTDLWYALEDAYWMSEKLRGMDDYEEDEDEGDDEGINTDENTDDVRGVGE